MEQKNNIILDMAPDLAGVEEIFLDNNKTAINKDAITAAMTYLSGIPVYETANFGISQNTAVCFYKKFDELDKVQITAFLKSIKLEAITKIEEYAPPLRKELTKAVSAIRDFENAYSINLTDLE